MAADSLDSTTGAPEFSGSGAPDTAVDLTLLGAFAAEVGTRLIGTTAARTAYAYARDGLEWYDTDLDEVYLHNGSGWQLWHKRPTAFTPTTSNVSGSPTITARYAVQAGVAHVEIEVALTGANVGSGPAFGLPVAAASSGVHFAGMSRMFDSSASATWIGSVMITGGLAYLATMVASTTYATFAAATATIPFTWASGDTISMSFDYAVA